ncbi:MAG TPA: YraN family protein [Spirochaetota bacterium]
MPSDRTTFRERGVNGEKSAEEFFVENDFEIVARNYRASRFAEIDLVVKKDNLLVFVEVKSRSSGAFGGVLYSISKKKRSRLRMAANHFLASTHPDYASYLCRFDLFGIENGKVIWVSDIDRNM